MSGVGQSPCPAGAPYPNAAAHGLPGAPPQPGSPQPQTVGLDLVSFRFLGLLLLCLM